MSPGLLTGRQVYREGPVPGHTSGKLPGKINKGSRLLVPGSRGTDRKNPWSLVEGVGGGGLPGIPDSPRPRPPWPTRSDRSTLERSGDVRGTDLPLDAGPGELCGGEVTRSPCILRCLL